MDGGPQRATDYDLATSVDGTDASQMACVVMAIAIEPSAYRHESEPKFSY